MKTLVVGAGGGGITSALLARMRGEDVTLLESHGKLGGCASWFKRGEFTFDAGATTLSGVGEKEPLGKLFNLLGRGPSLYAADPGITFHLSNKKVIRYWRDFERWMDELHQHFPGLIHRPFWEKVRLTNERGWKLLDVMDSFPPVGHKDYLKLLKNPGAFKLLPSLFVSTEQILKSHGLDHPDYLELVNGILLISAQAHAEHIPFLIGAMALSYPAETYAPEGGMKGLMDFFEEELHERGVDLRKRTRVASFRSGEVILSSGERISGERLIVNLPVWNLARMSEGELRESFVREGKKNPGSWGAFVLYFGIEGKFSELYQQVHLNHPLLKNYFVSFSHPDDRKRAPEGFQAVTISTHVYADEVTDKSLLQEIIMSDFQIRFPSQSIKHLTSGSPKTFERYTGRLNGYVGGVPFILGKNPLSLLAPVTSSAEIFRVGDTVFPGQGLCGVVAGALQLHQRLNSMR